MFSHISLTLKFTHPLPFIFSFLRPPPLVPALSYFLSYFPRIQGIHTSESSRVQTVPAADYANFMTDEKDIPVKVLILIFKDHRMWFVAVPGVACLSISCATADNYRDSEALSTLKRLIDFIVEGRRRIWTWEISS